MCLNKVIPPPHPILNFFSRDGEKKNPKKEKGISESMFFLRSPGWGNSSSTKKKKIANSSW